MFSFFLLFFWLLSTLWADGVQKPLFQMFLEFEVAENDRLANKVL